MGDIIGETNLNSGGGTCTMGARARAPASAHTSGDGDALGHKMLEYKYEIEVSLTGDIVGTTNLTAAVARARRVPTRARRARTH
jgi:hypothetical protein